MKANFHTHTYRCGHAKGTEMEMVQQAVEQGLSQIGISDHGPFMDIDYGNRMQYEELDDYLEQIEYTRAKHEKSIKVYKGLEIEYLKQYDGKNLQGFSYYEFLLTRKNLDYLLLGEHFFEGKKNSSTSEYRNPNSFALSSTEELEDYALSCKAAMETGYFSILAHPDVFMINKGFIWDQNCEKAADIIIESAVKNNVVLEYNANGIRRNMIQYPDGLRYPYPHIGFWNKVKSSGARVIVGSDCHKPSFLWDQSVTEAYSQLKALGITAIDTIFPED